MKNIEMYTSDTCPNCTKLKEYLKQNNIEYVEYNISKSSEHKRNLIKEGFLSVPVMKIDSDYVLGFDVPRINQLFSISSNISSDFAIPVFHSATKLLR